MGAGHCGEQRGIALPTAIVAALVVSLTASVVLNLVMGRFDLSVFRSDHAVARVSSEAGFQYAFTRLDSDPLFGNTVRNDANVYVVSPLAVGTNITVPYNGGQRSFTVDEQDLALRMGWNDQAAPIRPRRNVHVLIEEFAEVPPVHPPRLRVHAYSDFGTGQ